MCRCVSVCVGVWEWDDHFPSVDGVVAEISPPRRWHNPPPPPPPPTWWWCCSVGRIPPPPQIFFFFICGRHFVFNGRSLFNEQSASFWFFFQLIFFQLILFHFSFTSVCSISHYYPMTRVEGQRGLCPPPASFIGFKTTWLHLINYWSFSVQFGCSFRAVGILIHFNDFDSIEIMKFYIHRYCNMKYNIIIELNLKLIEWNAKMVKRDAAPFRNEQQWQRWRQWRRIAHRWALTAIINSRTPGGGCGQPVQRSSSDIENKSKLSPLHW